MGGPPPTAATTSSAPRRRSTRLIGAPRHDDQDKPPRAAPSPKPASTSSAFSKPRIRLAALRRRGDQQPPPPRASTPPPAAEVDAPPPSRAAAPRCSVRVHLCVRGLPSAADPSIPWRRRRGSPAAPPPKSIEAKAEEWAKEKAASGAPEEECVLPFLRKGAPRKVECLICSKSILLDERVQCSVNHCDVTLHKACSEKTDGCCLRHDAGPVDDIKEAFWRLPLPYTNQEFNIDPISKHDLENESEPPPYIQLKRNVYVVKSKSDGDAIEAGCADCDHDSTCKESCPCRSSLVSCSQACHCSVKCSNKPFRREKKVNIVKTQQCGWGAVALETIEKDEFVIEFVGEVIDDAMREDRLQDMRLRRDQNFYMCQVSKDFVIDATFRGNACRFFNHSCQPNCRLEKWQVNRKTRLGVFASQTIKAGTPLTYNYRQLMLNFETFSASISVQIKNVSAELPTAEGNCDSNHCLSTAILVSVIQKAAKGELSSWLPLQ
ncbi:hypothetical protein U9M48_038773, partial [Paspalum notatum var. saurae]